MNVFLDDVLNKVGVGEEASIDSGRAWRWSRVMKSSGILNTPHLHQFGLIASSRLLSCNLLISWLVQFLAYTDSSTELLA